MTTRRGRRSTSCARDGGEAWKLTDAKEGVSVLRLVARQHAHRLRHDRSRVPATKKPRSASATTSACSRAISASSTSGRSTSAAKAASQITTGNDADGRRRAPSWSPDSNASCSAAQADDDAARSTAADVYIADVDRRSASRRSAPIPAAIRSRSGRPTAADRVGRGARRPRKPIGDGTLPSYIGHGASDGVRRGGEAAQGRLRAATSTSIAGAPRWTR